jgi:hypothetical protein
MLRDAGVEVDPDQPLPGVQPSLLKFVSDRPADQPSPD